MPRSSREAMLRGIEDNTIIVGAYADAGSGGICPMLAAHRNGGRTNLASFARSWDRYTDARRPRLATEREVMTLTSLLESSLVAEDAPTGSVAALARGLRAERAQAAAAGASVEPERVVPEEPDGPPIRIRRLRKQPLSWLRRDQVEKAEGSPGRERTTSGIRQ